MDPSWIFIVFWAEEENFSNVENLSFTEIARKIYAKNRQILMYFLFSLSWHRPKRRVNDSLRQIH